MTKVLLAGESWISETTHYKGFDSFQSVTFETGADRFIEAARTQGIDVEQIYAHDVPARFPRTAAALDEWDVIILSDIGSNSFQLPPDTWLRGQKSANALAELEAWTRRGGGLMMAGGYLSFQGFEAKANFIRTPIAEALPVTMLEGDDRIETSQGAEVATTGIDHPLAAAWPAGAPELLGYNRVIARERAEVIATVGEDVLVAAWQYGQGRSLVWTSDIGPHWCPEAFLGWDGFAPLVGSMLSWLAGEGDR